MTQRSGLGSQIGFAKEAAYGTYKAPTRFVPFESESLELQKNYAEVAALQAGQMAQLQHLHKGTTRGGAGDTPFPFFDQGMGLFFDALHGELVVPAKIGTTPAYKQVHPIGLTPAFGKSYTCQVGRPDTVAGADHAFSYVGGKLMSVKISIDANGILQFAPTWDFQDEKTSEALAAAAYTSAADVFVFEHIEALIGGGAFANALSMSMTIGIPKKTDRQFLGSSGLKGEPIENALVQVTAEVTAEFASMAAHERFLKEEVAELALKATGNAIGEGKNMLVNLQMPAAKQVTSGPKVTGPDVITQSFSFKGLADGTHAPFIGEIVSTDNAL